jgi:hypothetical protein
MLLIPLGRRAHSLIRVLRSMSSPESAPLTSDLICITLAIESDADFEFSYIHDLN